MTALPTVELDPPTISMTFGVNDSPLAGRDGTYVRSFIPLFFLLHILDIFLSLLVVLDCLELHYVLKCFHCD